MEFSHCCNAYFHRCVQTHQWKAQGFWTILAKTLALEQSQWVLKTSAFKAFSFAPYA